MELSEILFNIDSYYLAFVVIIFMEYFVKPILSKFKFTKIKNNIISPMIVVVLSVAGSLFFAPEEIVRVSDKIAFGIMSGFVSTYMYTHGGVQILIKKLGLDDLIGKLKK